MVSVHGPGSSLDEAPLPPLVVAPKGHLFVPALGWRLDAQEAVDVSFISHGHADHYARHQTGHCTFATALILEALKNGPRKLATYACGEPHQRGDVEITLWPSGHVLGSAQLHLRTPDGSALYAGDVKLGGSVTAPPAETPRADLLILEGTYGDPKYRHASLEEAQDQVVEFATQCVQKDLFPVFLVMGRVGKAQDVLLTLGEAGLEGCLHESIYNVSQAYARAGVNLPPFHLWKPGSPPAGDYLVLTASYWDWCKGDLKVPHVRTAFLSGWAGEGGTLFDKYIAWSDHSDLPELLRFVERVNPREVWTFADCGVFAALLKRQGLPARSLDAA